MVSWHLLATQKQLFLQSIDRFFQAFIRLRKDGYFSSVSEEQYSLELRRYAFLNELQSIDIQQRILKNNTTMTRKEY